MNLFLSGKKLHDNLYRRFSYYNQLFVKSRQLSTHMKAHGNIPKLTKSEKKELISYWKQYGHKPNFKFARFMYNVSKIKDPRFLEEAVFYCKVNPVLCDFKLNMAWEDKNFYDIHFAGEPFPETIVHNIHGCFYDKKYRIINKEEAMQLIRQYDSVVIKPSLDTGGGKNVKLLRNFNFLEQVLNEFGSDFIIQKVIKQHKTLEYLNDTSINVFRLNTMRVDGEIISFKPYLRVIANDMEGVEKAGYGLNIGLDNQLVIGLDQNLKLMDKAFFYNGVATNRCLNGRQFEGMQIPGCDLMIDLAKRLHKRLMYADFASWDITIDENGEPVVIELNLGNPGGLVYQYCYGPFLGEYTDSILKKTLHC